MKAIPRYVVWCGIGPYRVYVAARHYAGYSVPAQIAGRSDNYAEAVRMCKRANARRKEAR